MVGRIAAYNQIQKLPTIIRGGIFTVVGSGGFTEAPITAGGWATYRPAVGHRALIKGTIVLNALGTNTLLEAVVFDNVAGRQIPVAQINATNPKQSFEVEIDRDFTCLVRGDDVANDGSCEVMAFIREVEI